MNVTFCIKNVCKNVPTECNFTLDRFWTDLTYYYLYPIMNVTFSNKKVYTNVPTMTGQKISFLVHFCLGVNTILVLRLFKTPRAKIHFSLMIFWIPRDFQFTNSFILYWTQPDSTVTFSLKKTKWHLWLKKSLFVRLFRLTVTRCWKSERNLQIQFKTF